MAKKQRLDKVLSNLGYGSRAEIKRDCKKGLVQVNGKVRDKIEVSANLANDELERIAKAAPKTAEMIEGKTIVNSINRYTDNSLTMNEAIIAMLNKTHA